MYDAVISETVTITGHGGDAIEAYSARPLTSRQAGGVVVLHHLPGYDRQTKEFTRSLAAGRAQGAIPVPDERVVGEAAGAVAYLKGLSNANGKIGVIGHCSGGRQSFLAAVSLPLDAAVDCYGGFVVGMPPAGHPLVGWEPIVNKTADLSCPLLGLFGSLDAQPAPKHVAELEAALSAAGKTYKFRTYEGANHGFLQVDSVRYHAESAVEAWREVLDWFGRYLAA